MRVTGKGGSLDQVLLTMESLAEIAVEPSMALFSN